MENDLKDSDREAMGNGVHCTGHVDYDPPSRSNIRGLFQAIFREVVPAARTESEFVRLCECVYERLDGQFTNKG